MWCLIILQEDKLDELFGEQSTVRPKGYGPAPPVKPSRKALDQGIL